MTSTPNQAATTGSMPPEYWDQWARQFARRLLVAIPPYGVITVGRVLHDAAVPTTAARNAIKQAVLAGWADFDPGHHQDPKTGQWVGQGRATVTLTDAGRAERDAVLLAGEAPPPALGPSGNPRRVGTAQALELSTSDSRTGGIGNTPGPKGPGAPLGARTNSNELERIAPGSDKHVAVRTSRQQPE